MDMFLVNGGFLHYVIFGDNFLIFIIPSWKGRWISAAVFANAFIVDGYSTADPFLRYQDWEPL